MRKIFMLVFLLATYEGFSQCSNSQTCKIPNPTDEMSNALVLERKKSFVRKKDFLFHKTGKLENESVSYTPCGFLDLIKHVIDKAGSYDGLRVYFGLDSNIDKLTLIFVPTRNLRRQFHKDDPKNYWLINQTGISVISIDSASKLILNYEITRLPYFDEYGLGQQGDIGFSETRSLWYDTTNLTSGVKHDLGLGLVDYLQCQINTNNINNIIVYFGGFETGSKYKDQLTLIFDFNTNNKKNPDSYVFLSPIKKTKGSNTDTGVPCPPPPSGSTGCPGAKLPQ